MKKNKFYYLGLLLCTLALGFTSCEKEDENDFDVSDLYGYWETVSATMKMYVNGQFIYEEEGEYLDDDFLGIRFDKNGEFYGKGRIYDGDIPGEIGWMYGGTYTYKNGKLRIYNEEEGETIVYDVATLTSSKLVLEMTDSYSEDGQKYKAVFQLTLRKGKL